MEGIQQRTFPDTRNTSNYMRKRYQLGKLTIDLDIFFNSVVVISDNCFFIGYLLQDVQEIHKIVLQYDSTEWHKHIYGSWTCIAFKGGLFKVITEVAGGCRLYYTFINSGLRISDDYLFIIDKKRKETGVTKSDLDYQYWLKHRYCIGGRTFIEGIFNFAPATENVLNIAEQQFDTKVVFEDSVNAPNAKDHINASHEVLGNYFNTLKKVNCSHFILMFSGGYDSLLLACYLMQYNIPFIPIYISLNLNEKKGFLEEEKVRQAGQKIGLNVEIIRVDAVANDAIYKMQLFDRHFSILHYNAMKSISQRYGQDICIINGQGSDSILSFGPSELSIQSFMRRWVLYKNDRFSKFFTTVLSYFFKQRFSLPKDSRELTYAFIDETKYCFLVNQAEQKPYYQFIRKKAEEITATIKNRTALQLFTKINTFLQGSDNMVVQNSAKVYGIKYLALPYCCYGFIKATALHKDNNKEILYPKYVIKELLRQKFGIKKNVIDKTIDMIKGTRLSASPKIMGIGYEERLLQLSKNKFVS